MSSPIEPYVKLYGRGDGHRVSVYGNDSHTEPITYKKLCVFSSAKASGKVQQKDVYAIKFSIDDSSACPFHISAVFNFVVFIYEFIICYRCGLDNFP